MTRKAKYKNPVTMRMALRIPSDLHKAIQAEAERQDLYQTDIVVRALRSYGPLKKRGDTNAEETQ